jgi:hypothetical protein
VLNLILAAIWLITGLSVLVYEHFNGPTGMTIKGLGISSGWFLLILSLYNVVRWYSTRAWKAEQDALRQAYEERMRQMRRHEPPIAPDPTFDFSDKPAQPLPGAVQPSQTAVQPPPQGPGEASAP